MKKKKHLYINFDKVYQLAQKKQQALGLEKELSLFLNILLTQNEFLFFLENNRLSFSVKKEFIEKNLKGFSPLSLKLILFFIEKRKIRSFDQLANGYMRYVSEKEKITFIEATVSTPLTQETTAKLTAVLEKKYQNKIILKKKVNPKILGGMILKILGGRILDLSLRTKLDHLKYHLAK